ncbi:hypothetical protein [Streptomyces sp. NPDC051665]|uniref:hypothetical protein n=1 Tax=Streptomyces sp. NPDC051665 TaxID=3154647 RepID=UPI00343488FF
MQKTSAERGMQLAELLALPVAFDLDTSNRALQLGRTKGFGLAKRGEYPIRLMRVGRTYRVTRADLLRALGIDPNDDGTGSSHPVPPENSPIHQL